MRESRAIVSRLSPALEQEALRRFSPHYRAMFSREGLLARTLVARELEHLGFASSEPQTDATGAPVPTQGMHWSVAHTGTLFAAALSVRPVGIDIERRVERDPSLFSLIPEEEWERFGERTWDAFYILWTAKEAFLKRKRLTLSALSSISLISKREHILLLQYHHSYVPVRCMKTLEYICSYTL